MTSQKAELDQHRAPSAWDTLLDPPTQHDPEAAALIHDRDRAEFLKHVEYCLDRKLYDSILDCAEARLNRCPSDMDARLALCQAWMRMGRLQRAREMIAEVEDIMTGYARVYVCLGDICRKRKIYDQAAAYYRKYLLINPDSPMSPAISKKIEEMAEEDARAALPGPVGQASPEVEAAPPLDADPVQEQADTLSGELLEWLKKLEKLKPVMGT